MYSEDCVTLTVLTIPEHVNHPKKKDHYLLGINPHSLLPQPLTASNLLSVSIKDLPILDIKYKGNPTICGLS